MNFLFACAGTAGHINPALAIAEEARRTVPAAKVLFIGADRELEKKLIPQAGFHLVNIKMSGLRRDISPESIRYNMNTARNLATAGIKAEKLISRFKPDAVIGTGGYICYPILKKAAQMGIPTVVHESNAVPGLTTKLLSAYVDRVLVSFPRLDESYRRPERVILTGTPVRGGFCAGVGPEEKPVPCDKPLVVSFWGSLGAERMNEVMAEFTKLNISAGAFYQIHAAGKNGGVEIMKNKLKKLGAPDQLPQGVQLVEYVNNMQIVMSSADIVICRAGGSTIAELTAIGKPAILIPSPYVTNDQQMENAMQIVDAGGAVMLKEKECTGEALFDTVSSLLEDKQRLENMVAAQKTFGVPDAAQKITKIIMELCKEKKESGYA